MSSDPAGQRLRTAAGSPLDAASGRVAVLGCGFDPVTFEAALDRAASWWEGSRTPRTIVTMNAALLMMMREDAELAHAVRSASLVVPDGVPVVWASRLLGAPLPSRVAGVDLMAALLRRGARERRSAYFLGARPAVVAALAARCAREHPGLRVAGFRDGYFGVDEHRDVVEGVRRSGADMLFVGMPSPFKEVWCERHRERLGVPLVMGVGGSFDVLAGFVRRAPSVMQRGGLEWLWRLLMEPRKLWRRYLVTNTQFLGRLAAEVLRRRTSRR